MLFSYRTLPACLFASLCVLAVAPSTGFAETIFSNLVGTQSSNLPVGATGADWTYGAQQFNSGSNNEITQVKLLLQRTINDGSVTGTYDVEVWTDASNEPGSLVGAIATSQNPLSVPQSFTPSPMTFSGSVSILPSTNYWLVVNASNNTSQLLWLYTNDAPSTSGFVGVTGTALLDSADPPAPLAWATPSGITDGRLMMEITAVPEPATIGLLAAGLAGGLALVRRRR